MRMANWLLGLFVGLCSLTAVSHASPKQAQAAAAPRLTPAAVKKAYLSAYGDQSFRKGPFINFTGPAQKEFESLRKMGGKDYPARIVRLPAAGKMADSTAGIYLATDGGNFLSIVKLDKAGNQFTAKKVLASGSQSESGDFNWSK